MALADLSTSARACASVLPISSVRRRAALSTSVSKASAVEFIHPARSANELFFNARNASWAWPMRRSTSVSSCGAKVCSTCPVAGLVVAMAMGVPFSMLCRIGVVVPTGRAELILLTCEEFGLHVDHLSGQSVDGFLKCLGQGRVGMDVLGQFVHG